MSSDEELQALLTQLRGLREAIARKFQLLRRSDGFYHVFPRQDFVFEGDVCCNRCGLPIPSANEYLFICEKHPSKGWCFNLEKQIAKAEAESKVLDVLVGYVQARSKERSLQVAEVQDLDSGTCTHGIVFDEEAAKTMSVKEIRERFPRGYFTDPCPDCGYKGIYYASHTHYVAGDW